jgi:hypothetical protein
VSTGAVGTACLWRSLGAFKVSKEEEKESERKKNVEYFHLTIIGL